jgi:hypothetical protein
MNSFAPFFLWAFSFILQTYFELGPSMIKAHLQEIVR